MIRRGQRAGDGVARTFGRLDAEEMIDRLLKPAVQQMLEAVKRNQTFCAMRSGSAAAVRKTAGKWKRWMA